MNNLLLIIRYVRRYLVPLTCAVVSTIILVAVQLASPWIVKLLIANVRQAGSGEGSIELVTYLALATLGIYLVRAVMRFLTSYLSHVAGWSVVADARAELYEHLQRQSLGFYEDRRTGELMSRVVNDTDKFEHLVSHALPETLVNAFTLVGVGIVLYSMSGVLMLLTLLPVPLILLAVRGYGKVVQPAFLKRQEELAELNATLQDNLSGIREIQTFCRERIESGRVRHRIDRFKTANLRALRLMATFSPLVELTSSIGSIIVIYVGGRLAFGLIMPVEDLVAFFLYLEMFYGPIRALATAWEQTQEAISGASRVAELLSNEPDVKNRPGAAAFTERSGIGIEFRNVQFRYTRGETVLEDINLEVKPGMTVALVGPTGVGKTTLAGLIPRFYDVTAGQVLFGGSDVRDLTLESLRSRIGIVLQDVFLFTGTVRDNLLFGRPDASDDEMVQAAKAANAHEFIASLPEGYDTKIGERGIRLSGGQKQRLSIARALLKDAPVLILDEATSSVDTETEILIEQALGRLMTGRTTIVIAHRLSTIRNADLIVVLENRKIREAGTHEELIGRNGLYRRLATIQSAP